MPSTAVETSSTAVETGLRVVCAGAVDYLAAWDEQRRVHEAVADRRVPDTVLLLEHPSV